MYIDKLIVRDIASLRGEHVIEFKNMLAKEGLFAITGPTGSGKSTLLSAISLALYGQGAKKGLAAKDYVSEGAASAEVTLYFSIDSKNYKAYWNCAVLKKDGTPRAKPITKTYLEDLSTDQVLEVGASEVIKLTLDQFNQCVVLHQGEFAKFLTSTFSERRVILEKLVNISGLELIKDNFVLKYHTLDKEISALKERAQSSEIFSKEEHIELTKSLTAYTSELELKESSLNFILKIEKLIEKISEYKKVIDETTQKERLATEALEKGSREYQEVFNDYQKHEAALKEMELSWHEQRPKVLAAIECKRNLAQNQSEMTNEVNELSEISARKIELEKKLENIKREIESIVFLWSGTQNAYIAAHASELLGHLEELSKNRSEDSKTLTEINAYQSQLAEITTKAAELKASPDLLADEEIHSVKSLLEKLTLELSELADKKSRAEHRVELSQKIKTQLQTLEQSLASLLEVRGPVAAQELNQNILREQENLERARLLLGQYETIENLWHKSVEHGVCELCGNDHPKAPRVPLEGKDKLISEVSKMETELTQTKNQYEKQQKLELEVKQLELEKSRLIRELEVLNPVGSSTEASLNELETIKKTILSQSELKSASEEKLNRDSKQRASLQGLRESYVKINKTLQNLGDRKKENDKVCSEILSTNEFLKNSLNKDMDQLNPTEIAKLRSSIYHEKTLIEKKRHLEESIKDNLNLLKKDEERALERTLKIQKLKETRSKLELNLPEQYKEVDLNNLLENRDTDLKRTRDELWSEGQKLAEKKLACERAREAIGHIKDNLKIASEWILKLTSNLTELSPSVDEQFNWNLKLKEIATKFTSSHLDFNQMNYDQILSLLQSELKPMREGLKEQRDAAQTALVQTKSKLELYDKKMQEAREFLSKLIDLEKKFALMTTMKDFFWRNDFKNYVLSMIEEELIYITNEELTKLCEGRYQLSSRNSANGPEFVVIDKWISLTERKVASLSGGETFMVSLALSLGLAEMTRGKTQIDSFFIDEGFGSLDGETLDSVTEVLLGLRGRGKTIGVISHVEALTARLPRSLILSKHTGGQSTLAYQELV